MSNLPTFAVATPTLANDPFSGVTDRKVPSIFHPDFTGYGSILLPTPTPPQSLPPEICGE